MQKLEKILDKYWFLVIFLLSIPAIWALFVPGYFGASDDIHIAWLQQFHKTLLLGQIPPRFVPDLSFGFGYPLFNFIFPLPFYIGEVFHLLGLSFVDSIKVVFLVSVPFSGIFMYLLLKEFAGRNISFIGAVLYMYTPYRAVDLYIRGAIGEIVSFIFLPIIVLSIIKVSYQKTLRWIGIGGLAIASLILSHNISAYMFFPFAGLLILMQFFSGISKKAYLAKILSMIFLGLILSIYFWLPALLESGLMKYDTVFNFADHFPTIKQLIIPYWGYGASVPGPYDGMPFFLGAINILVLIGGSSLLFLRWRKIEKRKKILLAWSLIVFVTSVFLMNYRSTFIWNNMPLLPYFQFPWRFLILTTLVTPIFTLVFDKIVIKQSIFIAAIGLILISVWGYFRPQDFLGRLDDYYLNRYIPVPVASSEYLKTTEEYLRLPKYTQKRPAQNYPLVYSNTGKIDNVNKINDLEVAIDVVSEEGMVLELNKYFFPGWIAKIDGKKVQVNSADPFGQISLQVPPGTHKVVFRFEEVNYKKVLNAISLVSFLVSLLMVKNLWIGSRKTGLF